MLILDKGHMVEMTVPATIHVGDTISVTYEVGMGQYRLNNLHSDLNNYKAVVIR